MDKLIAINKLRNSNSKAFDKFKENWIDFTHYWKTKSPNPNVMLQVLELL